MIGWLKKRLVGRPRPMTTVEGDDGPVAVYPEAGRLYGEGETPDDAVRGLVVVICYRAGAFVAATPEGIKVNGSLLPIAFEHNDDKTCWRASVAWSP